MGDIRVVIQKPLNGGSGGGIPEAPNDGEQYGRQNETWTPISQTGGGVDSVTGDGVGGTATNIVMSFPDTGEVSEVANKKYVTDAEKTVIGNTSNTNTGDETTSSWYSN